MRVDYFDASLAQLAVAYTNIEYYRVYHLMAVPKPRNEILALGEKLVPLDHQPSAYPAQPETMTGAVDPVIDVSSERVDGTKTSCKGVMPMT